MEDRSARKAVIRSGFRYRSPVGSVGLESMVLWKHQVRRRLGRVTRDRTEAL